MPATFVHCLIAQQAIGNLLKEKGGHPYTGKLGMYNNFAITGATGPDYPYLTDLILYGVLHFGHNWSDRMHYENTDIFVKQGVSRLSQMDKQSEDFFKCLAWFCGYVSHIVADSFVHPTINTAVGGIYIFTYNDHRICEMVQDVYIFQQKTGEEIVQANPGTGTFGYLKILDECSDPADPQRERFHPAVKSFWTELLKEAHPHASDYFADIDPDTWHKNYKSRVNFIINPGPIFRHVLKQGEINYKTTADITPEERERYIEHVPLPDETFSHYDQVFDRAVGRVMDVWRKIFPDVENGNEPDVSNYIMDWNLDTGVDQNKIFYW